MKASSPNLRVVPSRPLTSRERKVASLPPRKLRDEVGLTFDWTRPIGAYEIDTVSIALFETGTVKHIEDYLFDLPDGDKFKEELGLVCVREIYTENAIRRIRTSVSFAVARALEQAYRELVDLPSMKPIARGFHDSLGDIEAPLARIAAASVTAVAADYVAFKKGEETKLALAHLQAVKSAAAALQGAMNRLQEDFPYRTPPTSNRTLSWYSSATWRTRSRSAPVTIRRPGHRSSRGSSRPLGLTSSEITGGSPRPTMAGAATS
jgi:hypothetical protein